MEQILATTLRSAAPLVLVAMAGVFAFRAGIFHLGLEGLMIAGAFATVAVGDTTGSVELGVLAAIGVCLLLSARWEPTSSSPDWGSPPSA